MLRAEKGNFAAVFFLGRREPLTSLSGINIQMSDRIYFRFLRDYQVPRSDPQLSVSAACIRLVRWAKFFSDKRNETNVPDADHSAH
jgi:hypothetical protein